VDRQLHLSDLLATALSIRRSQTVVADGFDQQWSATIVGLAEARCASIASESLLLRRFGARAWGGIGLSAAIVLTLGALSSNPLITQARDAMNRSRDSELANQSDAGSRPDARNPLGADAVIPKESDSSQHTRIDSTDSNNAAGKSAEASQGNQTSASAADRAGSGSGKTDSSLAPPADLHGTSRGENSSHGEQAAGGGESANGSQLGGNSTTSTSDLNSNRTSAPWNSSDWPQAQQRADEQIRAGNVPDAYRDVVRDYFAR
jgi:hypothetical protein